MYVSFNLVQGGKHSCGEYQMNFDLDCADLRCGAAYSSQSLDDISEEAYSNSLELLQSDFNSTL